jgi:hypothetical protein
MDLFFVEEPGGGGGSVRRRNILHVVGADNKLSQARFMGRGIIYNNINIIINIK